MKKYMSLVASVALAFIIIVIGNTVIVVGQQEQPDMTIDAKARTEVIENILKNLNDSYVFPEVAKQMETDVRKRIANKEYDSITSAKEFARKLTDDLQSISKDKHLRVRYSYRAIPVRAKRDEPSEEEKKEYEYNVKRFNFGFEKLERMSGNIGYIDLRGFSDPVLGAETVAAAMTFVSNTDALIFDLRQNGGGDPAMVRLITSYLYGDKSVHLNDLYFRPANKTEEFWTIPNVPGRKFGETKEVYVLTSNRTFSGGEEFANNLKVLKRATIIGETTGGGANPGGMFRMSENFGVFIPTGRAINPVTKTNWEGVGVKPDIDVPADQALKTAYIMALNKAVERAKDENVKGAIKQLIDKTQKELDELKKTSKK